MNQNLPANSFEWKNETTPVNQASEVRNTDWATAERNAGKKSISKLLWGTVGGAVLGATAVILADKSTRSDLLRGTASVKDKTVEFVSTTSKDSNGVVSKMKDTVTDVMQTTSHVVDEMKNSGSSSEISSNNPTNSYSNKTGPSSSNKSE
ncbi:YtxH domain-containing protein [Aneurinibacillus sp. Ricciae_BoGa-3]|uniref:YtxH domain-containing protein n=1 Tax=Aneurinibacillus sp. Ricciae_BoGa-3 TaxID=3022697 RepID=UPI002340078A|nr:YtxH domain-containing protein [Aneurinibacillus sp. Ricciae_BoGa-3]WCK55818.1 YtxH domain-containing protein [Aneurinibacillus sp. Ricciae_BoGa-3]